MKSLSSYVATVRQRAAALFRRPDQLKSDAADRRRAWDQVIADHRKPLGPSPDSGTIPPTQP